MPIVAMHIPRPVPCGLGEFFDGFESYVGI